MHNDAVRRHDSPLITDLPSSGPGRIDLDPRAGAHCLPLDVAPVIGNSWANPNEEGENVPKV